MNYRISKLSDYTSNWSDILELGKSKFILVKFNDGTYGARKKVYGGYQFLDANGDSV